MTCNNTLTVHRDLFNLWKRVFLMGLLISTVLVSLPMRTATAVEVTPPVTLVQAVEKHVEDIRFTLPGQPTEEAPVAMDPVLVREQASGHKIVRVYKSVPTTAYTSRPEETDSTPFITADGSHVRDGIVAANFLKFGTKIRIPELYGDKIFEVHDRMNKRYHIKVDIWMESLAAARKHGVRRVTIEIVEPVESSS